jgi:hypothetical protein
MLTSSSMRRDAVLVYVSVWVLKLLTVQGAAAAETATDVRLQAYRPQQMRCESCNAMLPAAPFTQLTTNSDWLLTGHVTSAGQSSYALSLVNQKSGLQSPVPSHLVVWCYEIPLVC